MVKYCNVRGCKSGLVGDRRNRFENYMRQPSLFKVPKNKFWRGKWVDALSQDLNPNQFVCDKHFREEDIRKVDRFMINGIETVIPRERWSLSNDNVVPVVRHFIGITEQKVKVENEALPKEEFHYPAASRGNVVKEEDDEDVQIVESSTEILTVDDDESPSSSATTIAPITIEELYANMSTTMLQGWCYFADESDLTFIHVNIKTRKEDIRFSVADNLSVKVSFCQRPTFTANVIISSVDDIRIYMETLQATILCKGTGLHHKEYASICTGYITSDDYKRWPLTSRCSWCRRLRKRLQGLICTDASTSKVQKPGAKRFRKRSYRLALRKRILGQQITIANAEGAERPEDVIENTN